VNFYRQIWRAENEGRAVGTGIYFLLKDGGHSHWHEVDAAEIWLYRAGAPLILSLSETDTGPATDHLLTPDLSKGEPQLIVPQGHWQAARTTSDYTLVNCTVSPGFEFKGFTLAAPYFETPLS
jgi:predicted cupin superfamily sugar epimerase